MKIGWRGWWALFKPIWYSTHRWTHPIEFENEKYKILDVGPFYMRIRIHIYK